MNNATSESKQILLLVVIGLIVRLALLPFSQTFDADAVTRTFMAYNWLKDPSLITSAVWLPIHLYFNAAAIWLSGDLVNGPKLMNILFAVATVIPLYKFIKNEFNQEGAFFATLTFLFIPIIIRNSLQALSGIPYAFFIVLALYLLSQGRKTQQQLKYGILAGLAITLAAGFRYEAWLLIAIFTGILFFQKQWKMMITFMVFSMIVPTFWMVGCYIDKGDIFYGPNGAYQWNVVLSGVNDSISFEQYMRRIFFFTVSWFFLLTPVVAFLTVFYTIKNRKNPTISRNTWLWLIPFVVLYFTFIYKAVEGTLLLQHRFTLSLILTSLPFYALMFQDGKFMKTKRIIAVSVIVLFIPYSFLNRDINSIPRLPNQGTVELVELINSKTIDPINESLIIDFIGWEDTYYLSLKSDIIPENIFRVNGAIHAPVYLKLLKKVLADHSEGFLVIKNKKSKLDEHFELANDSLIVVKSIDTQLHLEEVIYADKKIKVYRYHFENTKN